MTSRVSNLAMYEGVTAVTGGWSRLPSKRFQTLIHREAGIWLGDAKTALVSCRLSKRLRELDIDSLDRYCLLVESCADERAAMLDLITTNETHFFRDVRQFEFIERSIIPQWKIDATEGTRRKQVRVWSAGCSSGEEPYTLSMIFSNHLPKAEGWDASILVTDRS